MKVLHVLDHSIPLQSGYAFRTLAILREQRRLGLETAHVTSTKHYGATATDEVVDGLTFHRTLGGNGVFGRFAVLNQIGTIRSLERRLGQVVALENPDLLHAHSPSLNGIAAIRSAANSGLPVVYEVRAFWEDAAVDHGSATESGLRYRLSRGLETWVMRRAGHVTTICEGLRGEIVARGIPASKVTVIPNAVDPGRLRPPERKDPALLRELRLENRTVLAFIGSFYAYEGLVLLMNAFAEMAGRSQDLRLLLVGGGDQADELRRLAAELGIADRVVLPGRVPHGRVSAYYSVADVMVYPRLPMRLTEIVTPLKPLEAMAQGRIVVASDVGGHRELIRHGDTGFLFRAGDRDSLIETTMGVLERKDRWPALRAAGRSFVETQRNWGASVSRYLSIYNRLVGRRD